MCRWKYIQLSQVLRGCTDFHTIQKSQTGSPSIFHHRSRPIFFCSLHCTREIVVAATQFLSPALNHRKAVTVLNLSPATLFCSSSAPTKSRENSGTRSDMVAGGWARNKMRRRRGEKKIERRNNKKWTLELSHGRLTHDNRWRQVRYIYWESLVTPYPRYVDPFSLILYPCCRSYTCLGTFPLDQL